MVAKPRALVGPLLQKDNVSDETRAKLVYSVADREAVLVEVNLHNNAGISAARQKFLALFDATFAAVPDLPLPVPISRQYLRCLLTMDEVAQLAAADANGSDTTPAPHSIFRIWPDFAVRAHTDRSAATVKADAAARSYAASGIGVTWAVIDSGIDRTHQHFQAGATVDDESVSALHRDFTYLLAAAGTPSTDPAVALTDELGHGTHVAGIIAGSMPMVPAPVLIASNQPTDKDLPHWVARTLEPGHALSGMAPESHLVSLKVLDANGVTTSSALIAALDYVKAVNDDSEDFRIHGVNLSLGCEWYPDEYASGQSPLCRAVDDLVATGVVVVVSAGNSGAGGTITGGSSDVFGQLSTITDPGNSARAITVGSTHRTSPHTFGVTYTSGKGPTLDGRLKPDLVAPGERITSAATGAMIQGVPVFAGAASPATYIEDTGTSMAAPHVSGVIAAFLSVRSEYIGQADEIKRIFKANATSLDRHEFLQGAGLVDLMRVLSNV